MKAFEFLLLNSLIFFSVKALPGNSKSLELLRRTRPLDDARITHGYPAIEGGVPYIVGLDFHIKWCSGSIISNNFILTAAHCTSRTTDVTIYYGATWRRQAQFIHIVSKEDFIEYADWTIFKKYDIALIRTPYIRFGDLVNKIELPSFYDSHYSYVDTWAMACGWGDTHGTSDPDQLNCVDLKIIDSSIYDITADEILIGPSDGQNICEGDSGGPLVSYDDNRLIGITSYGGDCLSDSPSGFTRVASYLNWIRDNSGVAYY